MKRYKDLINIELINNSYNNIKKKTKHKDKILLYEMFYTCNITNIYNELKNRTYKHDRYNIFLLKEKKYRIIMSEKLKDKIINQLISNYYLFPILEKKLIDTN